MIVFVCLIYGSLMFICAVYEIIVNLIIIHDSSSALLHFLNQTSDSLIIIYGHTLSSPCVINVTLFFHRTLSACMVFTR